MAYPRTTFFCLVLLLSSCLLMVASDEVTSLLKFKESLSNGDAALSSWNASSSPPCSGNNSNWKGLLCLNGLVYGLRLEGMGLGGAIDMEALAELPNLGSISFMNNGFRGQLPEVKKMGGALRGLFLSYNGFSGKMDDDSFYGLNKLKKVYLEHNEFSGEIPTSLAKLPKLVDVLLNDNRFEGGIPYFRSKKLRTVNLANNKLRGPIPASLRDQDPGSFSGNNGLCGKPLAGCKLSVRKIVIPVVVVGVVALAAIVILACFIINRRRKRKSAEKLNKIKEEFGNYKQQSNKSKKEDELVEGQDMTDNKISSKGQEHGKLYFVREDRERFELQQLFRASAEVLGSGSFGSSYKAMLLGGPTMVVKRFRHMSTVGREEFHEHMTRLGRLSHPNLLPLVALYYKKDERLLVTDFVENGSLASHLHGKRSPNQPGLDWPTRLKIIKGIGRGLICLYKELPSLTLPHGHLKSTNVLLDNTFEPLLGDYALIPAINKNHARQFMVAYKSPELDQQRNGNGRATRKTDVWSLGILILEVLTGKFPANYLKQGRGTTDDLAAWVSSVVSEEWTGEVFDKEMKGTKNGEGEMLKLLKIGMCCCEWDVERRWDVWEAVERIEELRARDLDEDEENYSSYASEHGEIHTSRGVSDDDFSFSMQ